VKKKGKIGGKKGKRKLGMRLNLKRNVSKLISFGICLSVCCSSVFADVRYTSFQPSTHVATPGVPWPAKEFAKQMDGYPWCLITCVKIVMKDVFEKYKAAPATIPAEIDWLKINEIFSVTLETESRQDIDESLVKELFLTNKTKLDRKSLTNRLTNEEATQFNIDMNVLLKGHIGDECSHTEGICCTNANLHDRIQKAGSTARLNLFDGLMAVASRNSLQAMWDGLNDKPRKMIQGVSDDAVLKEVKRITSATGSGLVGEVHNIEEGSHDVALTAIKDDVYNNRRAVIMIFQNPANSDERHACVVFGAANDAPGHLAVYNPWGDTFFLKTTSDAVVDMRGHDLKMVQYITFNY
jgi:hypothetical protein